MGVGQTPIISDSDQSAAFKDFAPFPIKNPGNYCYFITPLQMWQHISHKTAGKLLIETRIGIVELGEALLNILIPNE